MSVNDALFAYFFDAAAADFRHDLHNYLSKNTSAQTVAHLIVKRILHDVDKNGDKAVLKYAAKYDGCRAHSVRELCVSADELRSQSSKVFPQLRDALTRASERITSYADHQKPKNWSYLDEFGNKLGQKFSSVPSAGLYIPGGKASYPSSVLMCATPAKVAGVTRIVMVTPSVDATISPPLACAALLAGVDEVYLLGGAHAIAALAYGTETIAAVSKIVGPGNIYVTEAKRQVFGHTGIDMLAGPSECLVVADASSNPKQVACDLFAQAEHDEEARTILLSPDATLFERVSQCMEALIQDAPRREIISKSLANHGLWIHTQDLDQCAEISNMLAPEHLQLSFIDAPRWEGKFLHAGAIFVGQQCAEVFGDYCAGPNHVLPTARGALFHSPLGVYDFIKRTSLLECSSQGSRALAEISSELAKVEGLYEHARSAQQRID